MWTTADLAASLARHPHAAVRRAVAANEATPPQGLAMLITGEGLPEVSLWARLYTLATAVGIEEFAESRERQLAMAWARGRAQARSWSM
ncbi:hypothetical protein [Streptomyces sp. NBC_01217]|uniref:hypothetical protein n=1 Tax=Streptomyces sp. NBC_01217 TaxID=2903779 RepID=UPI002E133F77|nr:hypothetical protein OG507_00960 [Streptomyces sp. NBC_01217]